jgi:hypothetical protein
MTDKVPPDMMPLLIVALLVWAGVFAFLFAVDRKITAVEKRINSRQNEGRGPRSQEDNH